MAVYAFSDLHGYLDVYKKIKAILKPEDKVYFLGDAGDRGPESWECVKAIYADPQFIYLKGNHEDMLINAANDYLKYDERWDSKYYYMSVSNGGGKTLEDWEIDPYREAWISHLQKLPTWDTYEAKNHTFFLSHAGISPWINDNKEIILPSDHDLIWNRDHFYEDWNEEDMDNDIIVVHGHTPIPYLAMDLQLEWESGVLWYENKHKVCIDSGGFLIGEWVLLNLDTLEETIITL